MRLAVTDTSFFVLGLLSFMLPTVCVGQSSRPTAIAGVLVPVATGVLGKQDPTAVAELTAHQAAVGGVKWKGMQGSGTMSFGAGDSSSYPATLSSMGQNMFRLDVQEQNGTTSTRIHGPLGKVQHGGAQPVSMPVNSALAGIFPFGRLRNLNISSSNVSLTDRGIATVGGVALHRITLEYGAIGRNTATYSRDTTTTDLYFDPTTHLLLQSAAMEPSSSGRQANFLVVVTYGDYRTVGTSLVPFRYTETIEGQMYSTLQLSSVQLDPSLASAYFEF